MAEVIDRRLMYIRSFISQFKDQPVKFQTSNGDISFPSEMLYSSLRGVLESFRKKAEKAALEAQSELLQDIFSARLPDLIGAELASDLKALASLRNIFAHGRDYWFKFQQTDENLIDFEKNPLQLPAQRLLEAGVLKTLKFDAYTHHELQDAFYSDEALLYFLGRAKEIESCLHALLTFGPEKNMPFMISLPDLSVDSGA